MTAGGVSVRGGASAEELAVVLALLAGRTTEPTESRYDAWRRGRLAALRGRPGVRPSDTSTTSG